MSVNDFAEFVGDVMLYSILAAGLLIVVLFWVAVFTTLKDFMKNRGNNRGD